MYILCTKNKAKVHFILKIMEIYSVFNQNLKLYGFFNFLNSLTTSKKIKPLTNSKTNISLPFMA